MKKHLLFLLSLSFIIFKISGQTNVSGVISTNTTWSKANSPYNVIGNLLINSGITLTIDPGVEVNFSSSKKLTVDGTILSIGTITDSIKFTGTAWNGITINSGSSGSNFKYSIIENATGNSEEVRINLYGTTIIERCRVSNTNQGIMAYNSTQILYSKIYKTNCFGLYLESNSSAIGNIISDLNGCNNSINVNNGCTFSNNRVSDLTGEWGVRIYSGAIVEKNVFTGSSRSLSTSAIFCQGGIGGGGGGNTYVRYNKFSGFKNGILIARDNVIVNGNSFVGSIDLAIQRNIRTQSGFSNTNTRVDATGNYWQNVSADQIPLSIEDYNDDYTLQGNVDYSSQLSNHSNLAPLSETRNVTKKIISGSVNITWSSNTESDIAGYKIYYGGYNGYSYTNVIDVGNVTSYTLPSSVGINEDIAVTAYDASKDGTDDQLDGNESWYSPANKVPDQVTISSITPSERQVQLNWASVANANKYNIYKSTDSSSFTLLTSTTSTSYIDQNLNTLQQRYYYKVSAFDSLDLSYTNYGLEGTHSLIKGAKPTNKPSITSVVAYTDSIKLNFSYNSNLVGINNIKVYRTSATESRAVVKTLTSTATTYTDNVTSDKQYTYDVTITSATDESDASASSNASAFSIPVLSDKYHNKFDFAGTDTLKWRRNSLATKYQFQIDTVTTFSSAALITTNPTDTFYTNSGLTKNKYLYWRVRSGDDNGYSTWSNYYTSQIAQSTASIDSIYSYTGQIKIKINKGNYLGVDSIYVYRSESGQSRSILARLVSTATSFTDDISNGKYYNYEIAVKNNNDVSKLSGVKTAAGFSIPSIVSPTTNQFDIRPTHTFKFSKPTLSAKYVIEYDTVNTFNSGAYQSKALADTSFTLSSLTQNQNYFWRAKGGDDNGYSSWSEIFKFQTYVKEATLDTVIAGNKKNTIKFTLPSEKGISKIYILRDTIENPSIVIDSSTSIISQYSDEKSLSLYKKYYYSVRLVNTDNINSDLSVIKFGIPFNTKPTANTLTNKSYSNVGEYNTVRTNYTASGSKDPDGSIAKYQWYVNDSLVNDLDSILVYYYPQGTNNVKLVITDNDGDKDSSSATVTLKSFVKKFTGGILGGIAALSPDIIYVADSSFDAVNGASISRLDRSGNTSFGLVVSSKIFTTPSVSQDSSVFITSGSNLNGFSKTGAPLWSTIPLGGLSQVTPTVDSINNRIYLGVANKNFFAIDYKTGKVVWSFQCDAPINASAVITGDRKLVFVSQAGTLYGFDIRGDSALTKATWTYTLGETIAKSAAVDDSSNLYFGTTGGKLIKLKLNRDGSVTKYWTTRLTADIETSPVLDASGYVYIGTKNGKFYKMSPKTGETIWEYAGTGSIKSTPALTDFGTIVFATTSGQIVALDTLGKVKWLHKEESPISANLLYIQNMVYAGTEAGNLVALYDNPNTNTVNTSLSKNDLKKQNQVHASLANINENVTFIDLGLATQKNLSAPYETVEGKTPVWGTFQGNYRRTGSKALECPEKPTLNKTGTVTICNGENVELTTSALTNSTWVVDGQETTNGDGKLVAKSAGVYKRIARNDNGCKVYSEEVTIKVNEAPTKPSAVASSKTTVCEGETVQLNSSSSINNSWYRVGSATVKGTLQGFSVDTTGSYFVKVTLGNGCSSNSDTLKVTVNAKPETPKISYTSKEFCNGDSLILSTANSYQVQWFSGGTALDQANKSTYTIKNPGTYSVKVTSKDGCSSISNAVDISVKPTTEIPSITPIGLPSICQGSSLLLTSSVNANTTWYKDGIKVGTGQFLTITDSGYYKVTAMRTNMCMSQSDSLKVTVNKIPTKPTVIRNQADLVSNYTSGNQWYGSDGTAITGATDQKYRPSTNGYYTVRTTQNGCASVNSEVYYYVSTAVANLSVGEYFKISPNPTNGDVNLDFKIQSLKEAYVTIFDMNGKVIISNQKTISGSKLNLNKASKGNHIIQLRDKEGKLLIMQKLLKN